MGNLGNPILVYAERQSTLEEVLKYNMEAFVYLVCSVDKEEDSELSKERARLIVACYSAMMAAADYYKRTIQPSTVKAGLTSIIESLMATEDDKTKEGLQRLTYQTLARAALAKAENKE